MQKVKWNNYTLSKLCLGTVQFGIDYGIANTTGKLSQNEVNDILDYVLSKEIDCFDTARAYGNSESVIGNYIEKNSNSVEELKVVSKMKSKDLFLTFEELTQEVVHSLSNISKEGLFALLLHDSEALYQWDNKLSSYIKRLKSDKKIENFGVSIYTDEEFNLALNNDDVEIIQIPFNLFDQRAIHKKWLTHAKEKNKLIFIRSIYLQGLILMDIKNLPDNLGMAKKYIKILDDICTDLNISKNELALSFVNKTAQDSILLFGCDNLKQAKENINNFNNLIDLDEKVIQFLEKEFSSISEEIYNPTKWS
jgi:aryl-alcohol dehydrogenase-like predicted oxidoreductase